MASEARKLTHEAMKEYAAKLNLKDARILDVGVAGDPILPGATSPSEKYEWFGKGNYFRTADADPKWHPDYVADITGSDFGDSQFDLVIVSNVLEHVFEYQKALKEIHRITSKWVIIDLPFVYPYHPEPPSFGDYWRMSPEALRLLLEETGFKVHDCQLRGGIITTALAEKIHA